MLFYQIETPEGKRLVRTQGEAKQRDPNFKPFEFPTDKGGQMKVLNDLIAAASGNPAAVTPVSVEETPIPVAAPKDRADGVPLHSLPLTAIDRILLRSGVEDVILHTMDAAALARLEPVIAERRRDLGVAK